MPVYGVKFRPRGETSFHEGAPGFSRGAEVMVETPQGLALATVVSGPLDMLPGTPAAALPRLLRLATEKELLNGRENARLCEAAASFCRQCIAERKLDMKLTDVEIFYDRSKYVFYFTAPTRIDFRDLVKDLVRQYRARIELRQIGVRHETQLLGAVGNCGMVCCCKRYLHKFAPVTIRMAKEQNLFLNPAKISGICGRLMCCLAYEQDNYDKFQGRSPKPGKKYLTREGPMKVLRASMFKNSVSVLTECEEERELSLEQWEALEPRRPDQTGEAASRESTQPGSVQNQKSSSPQAEIAAARAHNTHEKKRSPAPQK